MLTNSTADLTLEPLPSGELAWLRLDPERVVIVDQATDAEPVEERRYDITDAGRRALALDRLGAFVEHWTPEQAARADR